MAKDIFLTNSLGGKKEKFTPKNDKSIGMYVCGPTVYDDPHIGNARPLVVFDILYKILKNRYGSASVKYIRNITDIDDKIIKASNDQNISINDLTSKITENFHYPLLLLILYMTNQVVPHQYDHHPINHL